MLKQFSIKNFKPFGDTQVADLAPITLIYGPNSSGKSSFIQSLLVLKQTLNNQRLGSWNDLITRGELVDVGNFISILHRHDVNREIQFGFSFAPVIFDRSPFREMVGRNGKMSLCCLFLGKSKKLDTLLQYFLH